MDVLTPGRARETYLILTSFTPVDCGDSSADGDAGNGNSEDLLSTGQTVSIMQWDRVTKQFDRIMSQTDSDSLDTRGFIVPAVERRIHDTALILNVQDTVHAHVVHVTSDLWLLAVSSVSTGLIMYEWRFPKVVGLRGASAMALDADGSRAFVASAVSQSLALQLAREHAGKQRRGRAPPPCGTLRLVDLQVQNYARD